MILPPRPLRNNWVRLPLIAWAVYLVVAAGVLIGSRNRTRHEGQKEVEAMVARLDAEEPGWRWADIEAARGPLPEPGSADSLPVRFQVALTRSEDNEITDVLKGIEQQKRLNRRLNDEVAEDLRDFCENSNALPIALEFQNGPGVMPQIEVPAIVLSVKLDVAGNISRAVTLLGMEAERLCCDGNANLAVARLSAMLNAERSIGSEPFVLSQIIRMAGASRMTARLERILALTEPSAGLAELQADLLAEARVDFVSVAFRGERALLHELFLRLETGAIDMGKTPFNDVARGADCGRMIRDVFEEIPWLFKKYLPGDHAALLVKLTEACAASARPESEHPAAIGTPSRRATRENVIAESLTPSTSRMLTRQMQARARLRCAAVAIAVERFRRASGRWPDTLAEIPPDVLPAVPLDPFDGKPLKYRRLVDGAQVYSIQADVDDAGFGRDREKLGDEHKDLRFRLFDRDRRALNSPPEPLLDFFDFEFRRSKLDDDPPNSPDLGPPPRIVAEKP